MFINQVYFNAVNQVLNPVFVTFLKHHTVQTGQQFYLNWRNAHSDYPIFICKKLCIQFRKIKTKFLQNTDYFFSVLKMYSYPDIKIGCCAWISMISDRVSPNQEILNLV